MQRAYGMRAKVKGSHGGGVSSIVPVHFRHDISGALLPRQNLITAQIKHLTDFVYTTRHPYAYGPLRDSRVEVTVGLRTFLQIGYSQGLPLLVALRILPKIDSCYNFTGNLC